MAQAEVAWVDTGTLVQMLLLGTLSSLSGWLICGRLCFPSWCPSLHLFPGLWEGMRVVVMWQQERLCQLSESFAGFPCV